VVAAAAGPVGATVAQLAAAAGARVVAIAGGPEKVAFVREELRVSDVLDHREPGLAERLRAAARDGVDVYFENVGGLVLEAVRPLLNTGARIPVCGIVAEYDAYDRDDAGAGRPGPDRFPAFYRQILVKSLQLRGFIATEFVATHYDEFEQRMARLVAEGVVRHREDVTDGLDRALGVLAGVIAGRNLGKAVVRVS
jgi:NADPH-dependent curcumin reductase CurA